MALKNTENLEARFSIRLTRKEFKALNSHCKKNKTTKSSISRTLILKHLESFQTP